MARIKQVFASGTIANVIFYQFNGKPCARSRPARVRQTTATQKESKLFGSAKTLSRLLRQSLEGLLPHYRSKTVMYRVDKGVMQWMRTVQAAGQEIVALPGFPCTGEDGFNEWLKVNIRAVLSGTTLQVTVPAIETIPAVAGSSSAVLTLAVACIDPRQARVLHSEEQRVEISVPPAGGEVTILSFEVVVQEGVFLTLSAALSSEKGKESKGVVVEKRASQPVVVLEGWYGGETNGLA